MTALDTWKRGPPGRGRLRRLCSAKDGGIGAEMVGLGSGWFGDTTTDIGMSPLLVIPYHRGRGKARPYFQNHHCCREYPTTRLILEISIGVHPRQSAGVERSPHRLTQPIKLN